MTSTIHKVAFGIAVACAAFAAQPATAQQPAKSFKIGIVTFLSGPAAGPFGVPARNAAELLSRRLMPARCPHPTKDGYQRDADRDGNHRRGGRHDQAGDRIPQPRPASERRRHHRLHFLRRLSSHRAAGGRAQEAHHLLRLWHAPHLRGRQLQIPVPNGSRTRQWITSPLLATCSREARHQNHCRHQSELRMGPGFLDRLQASMQALQQDVKITTEQFPKLAPVNTARRSRRCSSKSRTSSIHFWGGDMEAFVLQGTARGLFEGRAVDPHGG